MKLRRWQAEAIRAALSKYQQENTHFLCLATPGAGKTYMASILAKTLVDQGEVDLIFCFSPSLFVSSTFAKTLESVLQCRLDGMLGSKGRSLTYQSMATLDEEFWSLLQQYRTLVIFDEIHHCSGSDLTNANVWGETIIRHIQGRATYTLALTGTPWRSDSVPITLSSYSQNGHVICDYSYGLDQAIKDKVCRTPNITAIDNESIRLTTGDTEKTYTSFADFLSRSNCTYQQLLEHDILLRYILKIASNKLNKIRNSHEDAGGLIVAASVEHALQIARLLRDVTGEIAHVVTYMHDQAQDRIRAFTGSHDKWIISVGMISEGTDIPRLRVCCHLTRIKTELYFRQVMGRILRIQDNLHDTSYFFMPAEESLKSYAQRVFENVPEAQAVHIDTMVDEPVIELYIDMPGNTPIPDEINEAQPEFPPYELQLGSPDNNNIDVNTSPDLSEVYDTAIGLFGRFKKQVIHMTMNDY